MNYTTKGGYTRADNKYRTIFMSTVMYTFYLRWPGGALYARFFSSR